MARAPGCVYVTAREDGERAPAIGAGGERGAAVRGERVGGRDEAADEGRGWLEGDQRSILRVGRLREGQ